MIHRWLVGARSGPLHAGPARRSSLSFSESSRRLVETVRLLDSVQTARARDVRLADGRAEWFGRDEQCRPGAAPVGCRRCPDAPSPLVRNGSHEGIDLARSTLWGWVAEVATALTLIGDQLRREITAATYLQTDNTFVTVLDERGGKAGSGRISIPSGDRSSAMRRPRTNGTGPRGSSPSFAARCKPTATPAMTGSTRADRSARSVAGRMRGGALSRR